MFLQLYIFLSVIFSSLTSFDGLSTDACRCVIKDSRGFVWVGTEMGLNRFDGRIVKTYYRNELGVESDYVLALTEDPKGNIWIGTSSGPVVYDYKKDCFVRPRLPDGSFLSDFTSKFVFCNSDEIWFSAENEPYLYSCSLGNDKYSLVCHDFDTGRKAPKPVAFCEDGILAIACKYGDLYVYNTESDSFYSPEFPDNPKIYHREDLIDIINVNGLIYMLSSKSGLTSIDFRSKTITSLVPAETIMRPCRLCYDGFDSIWITASAGIFRYNIVDGSLSKVNDKFSIGVYAKGNEVWGATLDSGVVYYNQETELFKKTEIESAIQSIALQDDGKLFLNTENGEILCYERGKISKRVFSSDSVVFSDFIFSKNNTLIGATRNGMLYVCPEKSLRKVIDLSKDGYEFNAGIRCKFLKLSDGNVMLCYRNECFLFDEQSLSFSPLFKGDVRVLGTCNSAVVDNEGFLWILTYSAGVCRVNLKENNEPVNYSYELFDIPPMISSICLDSFGRVWLIGKGSQISLYNREKDNFIRYDRDIVRSFPEEDFLTAQGSGNGDIWIGTRNGLVRFDSKGKRSVTYTVSNGLLDNKFLSVSKSLPNGNLVFVSSKGLIEFNPESIPTVIPRVEIVSFNVSGEETHILDENINLVKNIDLPLSSNSFSFSVSIPGQNFYESVMYKLEGFDETDNVLPSDGIIRYYNVPAGHYILSISGHDDLEIVITPPFWSSPFGIFLIALLSILISAGMVFYLMYRKSREREMQEKLGFLSGFIALEQFDINSGDAEFIRNLDRIVTKHISDGTFSVAVLEEELAMSHATLNRRMVSVLNTSPSEYIKTKRLAIALNLLRRKGVTTSEVCYRVGFNSPSYFARCFKEKYGCLPSEIK